MCSQWIESEQTDPPTTGEITSCPCDLEIAKRDERFIYDVIASTLRSQTSTCFRAIITT